MSTKAKPQSAQRPESTLPVVQLGYTGAASSYGVRVVGEWERGKLTMVMSASLAFDARPEIERIRMVMNEHMVPFCIFGVKGRWFDASAKEVKFRTEG